MVNFGAAAEVHSSSELVHSLLCTGDHGQHSSASGCFAVCICMYISSISRGISIVNHDGTNGRYTSYFWLSSTSFLRGARSSMAALVTLSACFLEMIGSELQIFFAEYSLFKLDQEWS